MCRFVLLFCLVIFSWGGAVAQEGNKRKEPKWAFKWRVGDWWLVKTFSKLTPYVDPEDDFGFLYHVERIENKAEVDAFVVGIYKVGYKTMSAIQRGQPPEPKTGDAELLATLYIRCDDYAPLDIIFPALARKHKTEQTLKTLKEKFIKRRVLTLLVPRRNLGLSLVEYRFFYPQHDDPQGTWIVVDPTDPEKQITPMQVRRYLLKKDELWVFEQESLREVCPINVRGKTFYGLGTDWFAVIVADRIHGLREMSVHLQPLIPKERKAIEFVLSRVPDGGIDFFTLGAQGQSVPLSQIANALKAIRESISYDEDHNSFSNLSCRSGTPDPKVVELVRRLKEQEPSWPPASLTSRPKTKFIRRIIPKGPLLPPSDKLSPGTREATPEEIRLYNERLRQFLIRHGYPVPDYLRRKHKKPPATRRLIQPTTAESSAEAKHKKQQQAVPIEEGNLHNGMQDWIWLVLVGVVGVVILVVWRVVLRLHRL